MHSYCFSYDEKNIFYTDKVHPLNPRSYIYEIGTIKQTYKLSYTMAAVDVNNKNEFVTFIPWSVALHSSNFYTSVTEHNFNNLIEI